MNTPRLRALRVAAATPAPEALPAARPVDSFRAGQGRLRSASRTADPHGGSVSGGVRTLLRLEGLVVLAGALIAYERLGAGWGVFAVLFLLPDLSLLGYLRGARAGAMLYNAAHSYLGPAALIAFGTFGAQPVALAGGLVWLAHIGFDRMLGYGLKYREGFGATHLGRIGRADAW